MAGAFPALKREPPPSQYFRAEMKTPLQSSRERRFLFGRGNNGRSDNFPDMAIGKITYTWIVHRKMKARRLGTAVASQKHVIARVLTAFLFLLVAHLSPAADLAAEVLAEMNLARTQPSVYAKTLATTRVGQTKTAAVLEAIRFLETAAPLPPLVGSPGMTKAALEHVQDLGPRGGRGHHGKDGSTPFQRISRHGQWSGSAAENIYYGSGDARGIVCAWIVDEGVASRQHRLNIFSPALTLAGVAHGAHTGFGAMCVADFAAVYTEPEPAVAGS